MRFSGLAHVLISSHRHAARSPEFAVLICELLTERSAKLRVVSLRRFLLPREPVPTFAESGDLVLRALLPASAQLGLVAISERLGDDHGNALWHRDPLIVDNLAHDWHTVHGGALTSVQHGHAVHIVHKVALPSAPDDEEDDGEHDGDCGETHASADKEERGGARAVLFDRLHLDFLDNLFFRDDLFRLAGALLRKDLAEDALDRIDLAFGQR